MSVAKIREASSRYSPHKNQRPKDDLLNWGGVLAPNKVFVPCSKGGRLSL